MLGEWRGHMLGAVLHMRGPEPRWVAGWVSRCLPLTHTHAAAGRHSVRPPSPQPPFHASIPRNSVQPAVDAHGNVLLWNGEVFGGALGSMADDGAVPGPEENDTDAVLAALGAVADDSDPQTVAQHVRCVVMTRI